MTRLRTPLLAMLFALSGTLPARAAAISYRLVAGSEVDYVVHARLLMFAQERIEGRDRAVTGRFAWTVGGPDLAASYLEARADAFDSGIHARDADVRDIMDVDRYPRIRFVPTGVADLQGLPAPTGTGTGSVTVRGILTVHGMSHAVAIPLRYRWLGPDLVADGNCRVRFTDFGMSPPSLGFGLLKQAPDALTLRAHLVAHRD